MGQEYEAHPFGLPELYCAKNSQTTKKYVVLKAVGPHCSTANHVFPLYNPQSCFGRRCGQSRGATAVLPPLTRRVTAPKR
eukprot:1846500-Pyramimonas_sp.AAC.1